jgi:hypothetical protein
MRGDIRSECQGLPDPEVELLPVDAVDRHLSCFSLSPGNDGSWVGPFLGVLPVSWH